MAGKQALKSRNVLSYKILHMPAAVTDFDIKWQWPWKTCIFLGWQPLSPAKNGCVRDITSNVAAWLIRSISIIHYAALNLSRRYATRSPTPKWLLSKCCSHYCKQGVILSGNLSRVHTLWLKKTAPVLNTGRPSEELKDTFLHLRRFKHFLLSQLSLTACVQLHTLS